MIIKCSERLPFRVGAKTSSRHHILCQKTGDMSRQRSRTAQNHQDVIYMSNVSNREGTGRHFIIRVFRCQRNADLSNHRITAKTIVPLQTALKIERNIFMVFIIFSIYAWNHSLKVAKRIRKILKIYVDFYLHGPYWVTGLQSKSHFFADMGEIVPFRVQILFLAGKKKVRSEAHRSKTFLRRIIYNLMSKK